MSNSGLRSFLILRAGGAASQQVEGFVAIALYGPRVPAWKGHEQMERNIESALRVSSVGGLASGELLISKAQPTDLIRLGNFLHNFSSCAFSVTAFA